MAKNVLLTATAPDGTIITRTTARTYTHVVMYQYDEALLTTFYTTGGWAKTDRSNHAFYAKHVAEDAKAAAIIAAHPTADTYVSECKAKRMLYAQAQLGKWFVAGWCGRPDLAAKQASKGGNCWGKTAIVPVN